MDGSDERTLVNRGTIIKMVTQEGTRIENHGTIINLKNEGYGDINIVSSGTIINAQGCKIVHSFKTGVDESDVQKELRRLSLRLQQITEECQRVKAVNEKLSKRPVDKRLKPIVDNLNYTIESLNEEIKKKDNTIESLNKEIESYRSGKAYRAIESDNEYLHSRLLSYETTTNQMRCQISDLKEKLKFSDRQQMIEKIEELSEKLMKAENRERVQKFRADQESIKANNVRQQQWDLYNPTKQEVKAYLKILKMKMDCE